MVKGGNKEEYGTAVSQISFLKAPKRWTDNEVQQLSHM